MQNHLLFPIETDIEQLSASEFLIDESLYENDLKEKINKKEEDKHYYLNSSRLNGTIINEINKNPYEISLNRKCENTEDIHKSFNDLNNFSHFQNTLGSFLEKKEDIQNDINLSSKEQELKILNEVNEYKLFSKSVKKEFSNKYSRNKIFNTVRLNCKRRRKYMGDDKRKRIKSDFYRQIKLKLNNQLKKQKIKMKFNWPQILVTDITKENNKKSLAMTLGKRLSEGDLSSKSSKNKENEKQKDKKSKFSFWKTFRKYFIKIEAEKIFQNNKEIINILEKNKKVQINLLLNKTMEDLYKEYIQSENFENSFRDLLKKGHYFDYVKDYIDLAYNFVDFYKNNKRVNKV